MKIEAQNWYKMRNGEKAEVHAAIIPNPIMNKAWLGFVNGELKTWYNDGSYYFAGNESNFDLISEWQEPSQVKLPEKLPVREGHISCSERENFNQLIDFCESLQAQITELKGNRDGN